MSVSMLILKPNTRRRKRNQRFARYSLALHSGFFRCFIPLGTGLFLLSRTGNLHSMLVCPLVRTS